MTPTARPDEVIKGTVAKALMCSAGVCGLIPKSECWVMSGTTSGSRLLLTC